MIVKCVFAGLVASVVVGCAWTESADEEPPAPPVQRIVYTNFVPEANEIWVARVDGSGKRRLAAGNAPKISPDGRRVAFERFYRDLMLVPTAGGRPRLLLRAARGAVWSPDSKRVAVLQNLDDRRRALVVIDIETRKATTLARGPIDDISFSPRGDEIAYSRGAVFGKVDVFVSDADDGKERRVTDDGSSAYPVWGPREIAFARIVPYRGWGAHEIWVVRPDGSGRRLLTKTPRALLGQGIVGLVPVRWSADGSALLAVLANEFGAVPFAVDPRSGSVHRIGELNYSAWPDGLSRDGRFALVSYAPTEQPARAQIQVVPVAGGTGRVVARRAGDASWNR